MNDTFIQPNRRDSEENFDIFLKLNIRPIEMKTKQASERKKNEYISLIPFGVDVFVYSVGLIYSPDLIYSVNSSWIHFKLDLSLAAKA